jgi:hypothetical protein
MVEEKKEENKETYSLIEIPTQTVQAFHNNKTNENLDMMALLVKIANDIDILKKNLV